VNEIQKLFHLDFPLLAVDRKPEHANELKRRLLPPHLFKYCSFDTEKKNIENIEKEVIYLKPASEFNDPFECLAVDSDGYCHAEAVAMARKEIKNGYRKIGLSEQEVNRVDCFKDKEIDALLHIGGNYKSIDAIKTEIKNDLNFRSGKLPHRAMVSCFSEVNDSVLMWSHYASDHYGFCIKYSFCEAVISKYILNLYPVLYRNERFFFTEGYFESMKNKTNNPVYCNQLGLIKSPNWSYEREWRLVYQRDDNKPRVTSFVRPEAIYLGCRADLNDLQVKRLLNICKQKEIEIYRMQIHESKFELVPNKIDLNDCL
jgi:hypothetical protein